MPKIFRFVVTALLMVVGLTATAGAFAQPPRYYRRPPYRRHFYHHRPYHRPYYRHHRPYYRR